MSVRRAKPGDLANIRRLLHEAQLPSDDLNEQALDYFLVLENGNSLQGAVGLEHYGDVALLRSLVIANEARGRGFGTELAAAAEKLASQLGVAELYLLTTSAQAFFLARHFRPIRRDESPAAIKGTAQFSALCPAAAIVMVKP